MNVTSDTILRWHVPALIFLYVLLIPYGESSLAIMLVFSLCGFYMLMRRYISISPDYRSWVAITLALSIPLAISLFTAFRFDKTLITLTTFLLHAIAGIYIIDQLRKHERPTNVIFGIAVIVGIWTVSALPYQVRGVETSILQQWVGHITGNYGDFPNIGNVLAHLSPFYFEAIYRFSKKFNNRWPWLLAIPLILSILMAGGRAGWIILILVMAMFAVRMVAIKHFSTLSVAMGLAIAIGAVMSSTFMLPQVERRVIQSLTLVDGGFEALDRAGSGRWQIWQETATLLPDRVFYGHGTHGTARLLEAKGQAHRDFGYEHLYWLEIAVSTGALGLVLYMCCFFYLVYLLLRKIDWGGYAFAPILAAVCILFPFNVHWEFYGSRSASLMWLLLALAFAFFLRETRNNKTNAFASQSTSTQ